MIRGLFISLSLASSLAVAQHIGHRAHVVMQPDAEGVIMTAKGEQVSKSRLERKATLYNHPWELRKNMADPTGIIQPVMEELEDGGANDTNHAPVSFTQDVNGSTPTGWMKLGTPPKWLFVIYDTGSDKLVAKTWDTLQNELASIDQGVQGMVLPSDMIYDHNASSSYIRKYTTDPHTNESKPARNEIAYGSGMAITDEGADNVSIGHFMLQNFSISEITADSLQLLHTKKGISGVLGLQHMKNKSLGASFFSSMRDAGKFTSFGYCRGSGDNGTFIWGDSSTEGTELAVVGQMHWAVHLGSIHINPHPNASTDDHGSGPLNRTTRHHAGDDNKIVVRTGSFIERRGWWPFAGANGGLDDSEAPDQDASQADADADAVDAQPEELFANGSSETPLNPCAGNKCVGILDTGSNIIAGPSAFMQAISMKVNVAQDCSNFDTLPTITLEFGGQNLTVHPEGYVMKVPMPNWADIAAGGGDAKAMDEDGQADAPVIKNSLLTGISLGQTGVRAKSGWKAVFQHLRDHKGIDLSTAMRASLDFDDYIFNATGDANSSSDNATASVPQFMCMPALVPLDKHTKYGPLFVVGTPLLQTHYARWSWKKGDDSPKIYIKKLSECETCKHSSASTPALSRGCQRPSHANAGH
jgi:hypothetical protein